jgi:hypothetical protein
MSKSFLEGRGEGKGKRRGRGGGREVKGKRGGGGRGEGRGMGELLSPACQSQGIKSFLAMHVITSLQIRHKTFHTESLIMLGNYSYVHMIS